MNPIELVTIVCERCAQSVRYMVDYGSRLIGQCCRCGTLALGLVVANPAIQTVEKVDAIEEVHKGHCDTPDRHEEPTPAELAPQPNLQTTGTTTQTPNYPEMKEVLYGPDINSPYGWNRWFSP
jgi:hypothetical protein